jgi:hypothetical protein
MVTLTYDRAPLKIFELPTRREWRDMLMRPAVAITAIVAGTLLAVSFLAAVTFLAYTGKGTEALTGAGMIGLITVIAGLYQKVKNVEKHTVPTNGGAPDGQ